MNSLLLAVLFLFSFSAKSAPVPLPRPPKLKVIAGHKILTFPTFIGNDFVCKDDRLILHEEEFGITEFNLKTQKRKILLSDPINPATKKTGMRGVSFSPDGKEIYFSDVTKLVSDGQTYTWKQGDLGPTFLRKESMVVNGVYSPSGDAKILNYVMVDTPTQEITHSFQVEPKVTDFPSEWKHATSTGISGLGKKLVQVISSPIQDPYVKKYELVNGKYEKDEIIKDILGDGPELLRSVWGVRLTSDGGTMILTGQRGVSVIDGQTLKKKKFIPSEEEHGSAVALFESERLLAVYPVKFSDRFNDSGLAIYSLRNLDHPVGTFVLPSSADMYEYHIQVCGEKLYIRADWHTIHQLTIK